MNRSTILRTLCVLGIVAVLGLAGVGLEHIVAGLSQARGSAAPVAAQPMATATVAASFPAQLQVVAQPTATATVVPPPPAQVQVVAQPTATATVAVPPPAQVQVEPEASDSMLAAPGTRIKVEGRITAVNAAAGTITVQDDDRPATVVALGAARGPYYLWQKVKVYGTVTHAARMRAQFIRLKGAPAPTAATLVGAYVKKVEGHITAVNAAAGTITVQDDDRPATMVALGTARGTYYLGQKVKVYGLLTSAGSNGATVQAQFISVDSPDGDNDGD